MAARCARTAALLRSFRLPVGASAAELRTAYLHEAKRLHPDRHQLGDRERANREFANLRNRFEEALELLRKADVAGPTGMGDVPPRSEQPWHWHGEHRGAPRAEPSIPVVGWPEGLVYAAFVALACSAAGAWLLRRPAEGEAAAAEALGGPSLAAAEARAGLRRALEGRAALEGKEEDEGAAAARSLASYYASAVRRTRSRSSPNGRVEPQLRHGVALSAAQVAAEDGQVWWLERCCAARGCQRSLGAGDRRADTPLHHCAKAGQALACRTLLRLGADPGARNKWHLLPEDLARHEGHEQTARLLRAMRLGSRGAPDVVADEEVRWAAQLVATHPDGLGVLSLPPVEVVAYAGPFHSESLRHSLNLAAGEVILRSLELPRADPLNLEAEHIPRLGSEEAMLLALEHARQALDGTGFTLESEEVGLGDFSADQSWVTSSHSSVVHGLLVYEPPGSATPDAPGHWHAVRPSLRVAEPSGVGRPAAEVAFYRLDPMRGPFRLTGQELRDLLSRYRAWRMVPAAVGKEIEVGV